MIYTFQRIVKHNFSGASALVTMDVTNLRKVDRYTVKVADARAELRPAPSCSWERAR